MGGQGLGSGPQLTPRPSTRVLPWLTVRDPNEEGTLGTLISGDPEGRVSLGDSVRAMLGYLAQGHQPSEAPTPSCRKAGLVQRPESEPHSESLGSFLQVPQPQLVPLLGPVSGPQLIRSPVPHEPDAMQRPWRPPGSRKRAGVANLPNVGAPGGSHLQLWPFKVQPLPVCPSPLNLISLKQSMNISIKPKMKYEAI